MRKYWQIFKSNWQIDLEYRFNFFLGRLQNIFVLLTLYYLWKSVLKDQDSIFGYSTSLALTYVIISHLMRNLVLNTRARYIGEEIYAGYLSTVLLKPISYFWQSFSEDVARRVIAVVTSLAELGVFVLVVRPPLYLQLNPALIVTSLLALSVAIFLHYLISFSTSLLGFWTQEAYAPSFLMEVVVAMLSGALYPLDALPKVVVSVLKLLPFYYTIFFPLNVYLGRVGWSDVGTGFVIMAVWLMVAVLIYRQLWQKGLRLYEAYGG